MPSEIYTPAILKQRLRSLNERDVVVVGREYFPVGEWTHLAADYIEQLEEALASHQAWLRASWRPIQHVQPGKNNGR